MPLTDAERLKEVRLRQGNISQQKLADILKIPVHRIKDIEVGKTKLSTDIALMIEEKFNYNFKWLLTGKNGPYQESTAKEVFEPNNQYGGSLIKDLNELRELDKNQYERMRTYIRGTLDALKQIKDEEGK